MNDENVNAFSPRGANPRVVSLLLFPSRNRIASGVVDSNGRSYAVHNLFVLMLVFHISV